MKRNEGVCVYTVGSEPFTNLIAVVAAVGLHAAAITGSTRVSTTRDVVASARFPARADVGGHVAIRTNA